MHFVDRLDAGKQLADQLTVENPENTLVLALPRGGIPLVLQIARQHHVPFDVVLAKKLVHPLQTEFAIGAIAEHGEPLLNEEVTVEAAWIGQEVARVRKEIERRRQLYNHFLTPQSIQGKDVILVDDGIATGMTMFAAIEAVKSQQPRTLTVAVPIIPKDTFYRLEALVDQVIYVEVPSYFLGAVGAYYQDFPQISDAEIQTMVEKFER